MMGMFTKKKKKKIILIWCLMIQFKHKIKIKHKNDFLNYSHNKVYNILKLYLK